MLCLQLFMLFFSSKLVGIDFGLKHKGRVLIGDEMGLGKTLQALAIASVYKDEWPILIISPSTL